MISASTKGLFSTDEGGVRLFTWEVLRAAVHQIAEEFPTSRNLEARNALGFGHNVQRTRSWHGPSAALQTTLELRDAIRICHNHCQGIRRRYKELGPHDH